MACKRLVPKYRLAETSAVDPSSLKSNTERAAWLWSGQWGCYDENDIFLPTEPDKPLCAAGDASTYCVNRRTCENRYSNVPHPVLQETGFLSWINEHGYQCVHRLNNKIWPEDTTIKGQVIVPGASNSLPPEYCVQECNQISEQSSDDEKMLCASCVVSTVKKNPTRCPNLDATSDGVVSLVEDCITCQQCIGQAGSNLNAAWDCIQGKTKFKLSKLDLTFIILGCVVFVLLMVVMGVLIAAHVKKKEMMASSQMAQQEQQNQPSPYVLNSQYAANNYGYSSQSQQPI